MSRRWFLLLTAVAALESALLASATLSQERTTLLCLDRRFLVLDVTPPDSRVPFEVVTMTGGQISIEGVCAPVTTRLRKGRRGTKILAVWSRCQGLKGKARLKATVEPSCTEMHGRFVVPRSRIGQVFSAWGVVSLSTDVQPVFATRCDIGVCHGAAAPTALDLRAGEAYAQLVNIPSNQCTGTMRVLPGNPDASYLIMKLRSTGPCLVGDYMPPTPTPRLPTTTIKMIAAWIAQGAADN